MGQYFDNDKLSSNMQKCEVVVRNCMLTLFLDNGVFSKNRLDFGTRLLLETIPLDDISGDILDMGCGYGPIGLFLAKMTNSNIDMCDVNKRALHLSSIASKFNKLKNVNIFESNCYSNIPDGKKYDFIITNPPIRVGKKMLYDILFGANDYLKDHGEMWLVVNKDQGAKSLAKDLSEVYDAEVIRKNKGFYIIRAKKR